MDSLTDAFDTWNKTGRQDIEPVMSAAGSVLKSALKSYVGTDDPIAMSHARVLASRAMKSYDPSKNTQLRTHLLTQLQPLRRFAAERRFVTKVPEQMQYDMAHFRDVSGQLTDKFGREPTDTELADKIGLSMVRIKKLKQFNIPVSESQKATESVDREITVTPRRDPMEDWMDYIYFDLSPVDKKILEWRTGYNGSQVRGVVEIAKALGLSAGAITQRANKISAMLESRYAKGGKPT